MRKKNHKGRCEKRALSKSLVYAELTMLCSILANKKTSYIHDVFSFALQNCAEQILYISFVK